MLRNFVVGRGSIPPSAVRLTVSPVPNESRSVSVLGDLGELELDVRVSREARPGIGDVRPVGVGAAVVQVEHVDLALHLLVGDVLLVGLVDDVDDHRQRDELAPHPLRHTLLDRALAVVLDPELLLAQRRVLLVRRSLTCCTPHWRCLGHGWLLSDGVVTWLKAPERAIPSSGTEVTSVFIISEVRLYREGLERLLRGDSRLDVIGGATDVPDALGHLNELEPRPDAVLLDVPAPVGLQAPGLLASALPDRPDRGRSTCPRPTRRR